MSAFHDSEVVRNILESLPIGLCVVDMQKKIVFWSDGAERITGHLRHEVIGQPCIGETLPHCDRPDCEFCNEDSPLARAIKTSHSTEALGFLHHKAGHEIPVRIRAVPIHNAHGSIIGALETFEDQQALNPDHREDDLNIPGCIDEITGVASRAMMLSHLRETLGTFADVQAPFGILLFQLEGLDHFRASCGSEAALSMVRAAAHTIEGTLWKTDFVGRWSDDQFLVILNGCKDESVCTVRERVRHMLANDSIEWWGERRTIRVSIGQATAQVGDTIKSLMDRAQKSLDAASAGQARAAASGGNQSSGS